MPQDEKPEFTLTDEQVENWRTVLVTMPLPPFMLTLGGYALVMPREKLLQVVERVQELLNEAMEREMIEVLSAPPSSNITRTRPRNPNKPQRMFR